MYINALGPFILSGSKYILSILHFYVGDHYIRSRGITRIRGFFEYRPMFVEQLPVPQISPDDQKSIEILVNCFLFTRKKVWECEASTFVSVIDGLVYEIYS